MSCKELRREIKRLKAKFPSSIPLNSPEYKLRWEFQRLRGLEARELLLAKGINQIHLREESGTSSQIQINNCDERRALQFIEKHADQLINCGFDGGELWIGGFDFRGYISFVY